MDKELREKILTPASFVDFKQTVKRRYYFGNTIRQLENKIMAGESDVMSFVLPDTELYRYVARKGQKCYTMAIAVQDVSEYYEYHEPAENGNSDGENNDV